jgi:hypothetical protein
MAEWVGGFSVLLLLKMLEFTAKNAVLRVFFRPVKCRRVGWKQYGY